MVTGKPDFDADASGGVFGGGTADAVGEGWDFRDTPEAQPTQEQLVDNLLAATVLLISEVERLAARQVIMGSMVYGLTALTFQGHPDEIVAEKFRVAFKNADLEGWDALVKQEQQRQDGADRV